MTVLIFSKGVAQTRLIRGTVIDSASHAALANVNVVELNKTRGTITDAKGKFNIKIDNRTKQLVITATGYKPYHLILTDTSDTDHLVMLSKSFTTLAPVVVEAKKTRYRNKNNPAVELIRLVIANKAKNGPRSAAYLSYDQYEKARILVDKPPDFIMNNFVMKKFQFVTENIDTALIPGKELVPVYLEEVFSQNHFRKQPEKKKKIVTAKKSTDLGEYLDMTAISQILKRLYEEVNIYDNSVDIFTMQFLSPIADIAPTFYKYFIVDTVEENGIKIVKLDFMPRNPEDLLFKGTLYITLDGRYAVKRIKLDVSKHININYIRHFEVEQEFEEGTGNHYYLASSRMVAFFSPFPNTPAVYGERIIDTKNVTDSVIAEDAMKGKEIDTLALAYAQPNDYWQTERPIALSQVEANTYIITDSLVRMRPYTRLMDIATLLTAGYKSVGKFEIGPVGSFYSFNSVEGNRLQFGIRSKPKLSTRYFLSSYVAYGFGDQRWKYFVSGTYSINHKSIYTFPFNYIQASYMHDTRILGQEDVFTQANSFLGSFNRGINNSWLYNNIFRISYVHELENHFSYTIGMKYWYQQPTGSLHYVFKGNNSEADTLEQITTTELSLTVRWAPHEQFYQGKATRRDVINKYPIITLQYAKGIPGLFGGQYSYDAFDLAVFKRFYLAPLGFSDIGLNAGYLFGNLPYPLLIIHPGNQSYFYSSNSYNLMNNGEFLSDHYASMRIDHYFNGFFFNKIPLIKKLRLREVIEAKVLTGGLRDENNPAVNPTQMQFPTTNGMTSSFPLGGRFYFEAGFGIYNIFSFLRIDLVKRFSFLSNPNISTLGVRFSTNLNF
ncbi:MAG: hypothetical protein C5B59_09340 [Bacteroidetes bacterium]|nr:MAG: hypothetical protein C5B59_09340 [Bacteroidota bacterium]